MNDHPIIFSGPMVQALLAGHKAQTRRLLDNKRAIMRERNDALDCVRFHVGDRLYVREAHAFDGPIVRYYATDDVHELRRKRPSIHMPRWASRLTLTVTEVRVQRLQEITLGDICAEGLARTIYDFKPVQRGFDAFEALWNSLHGPEAWDANPWVVALTFTVARGNIDQLGAAA